MTSDMGVNSLSCSPLGQQKTDLFHCLPAFTLYVLFLTLLMELFFESCFCLARGKYKKHIEVDLEAVISKIEDVIRHILISWWILFKSFNNSTLKFVNFVLIKRFRFQPQWKITLSHFYTFFLFFQLKLATPRSEIKGRYYQFIS